jgi:tRNA(Ile)-lysidine synthase
MVPPARPDADPAPGLQPGDLTAACPELLRASRLWVAFSGGLDSTVLLHLIGALHTNGTLPMPLHVLHINHGLQTAADAWQSHCRQVCANLGLPFHCRRVQVELSVGDSPEEAARKARHTAFAQTLVAGDMLVLAQHRDDQVETVLFRLLRGSGVGGLAGMPVSRACGAGLLLRPLLGQRRGDLLAFAQSQGLYWIEDGSNQDPRYDRNFLRGTVLPLLQQRWPGLSGSVLRSARLCGEAAGLLDELAALDLQRCAAFVRNRLRVAPLLELAAARQRNLLRYWLHLLQAELRYPAPTHQLLQKIVTELLPAAVDAEPLLGWGSDDDRVELHRFQDQLYALRPLPVLPRSLRWQTARQLSLPAPLGTLALEPCAGPGLPLDLLAEVDVRFRTGGEQVKAAGRPTRALKKILQDAQVPPWLRERVPLLYVKDSLVAVGDLLVCEGWQTQSPQNTGRVVWQRSDLDCGY